MNIADNVTSTINNETIADLAFYYQYVTFGLTAVVTNFIILYIFVRNKPLLKKSPFIFVLALGDLTEGLALTISSFVRIVRTIDGTLDLPVPSTYCQETFVALFLLGNQLPAAMFVLIGAERFMAVYWFNWYFNKWTNRLAWQITGVASAVTLMSAFTAWIIAKSEPVNRLISNKCSISDAVDNSYLIYNYGIAILGGIVAVVASVVALIMFRRRRRFLFNNVESTTPTATLRNHLRSQLHVTKVLLTTAAVDVAFVVLPTFLLFLRLGFRISQLNNVVGAALCVISARSALNVLVYILVNREFRAAALKTLLFKISCTHGCCKVDNRVTNLPPGISMSQYPK